MFFKRLLYFEICYKIYTSVLLKLIGGQKNVEVLLTHSDVCELFEKFMIVLSLLQRLVKLTVIHQPLNVLTNEKRVLSALTNKRPALPEYGHLRPEACREQCLLD